MAAAPPPQGPPAPPPLLGGPSPAASPAPSRLMDRLTVPEPLPMLTDRPAPPAGLNPRPARSPDAPAALRSNAGQPANAPCAVCQARQRPNPTPPCDFDKVTISCKHCKVRDKREIESVEFALDPATGQRRNNLVRSPNPRRAFVQDRFEVLDGDTVKIAISGGPGFHVGQHPIVALDPPASVGPGRILRGPRHEVEVEYEPGWFQRRLADVPRLPFAAGIRQFFFPPPALWRLEITACGARPPDQRHAFQRFTHAIAVYPADTFKLALQLPSYLKRETASSTYREGAVQGADSREATTSGLRRTTDSRQEETRETRHSTMVRQTDTSGNRHGSVTQTQTLATLRGRDYESNVATAGDAPDSVAAATAKSLTITHNGRDWSQSFKVGEFIEFLANLRKQILDLIEFFKAIANRSPRIGWSFTFEVEFASGTLEYEWGYKEWKKDHTVYKYYKVELAITVVTVKKEIAFGISLLGAKAQVYGSVSAELKLSASREADPDATGPGATISAAPQVAGEIGVRGALGDWVEVVGRINFGFEGGTTFELAPFAWKVSFSLSEGKGTFTARSKLLFSTTRSATLWDKRPILEEYTILG